jgi:hypothetical protein
LAEKDVRAVHISPVLLATESAIAQTSFNIYSLATIFLLRFFKSDRLVKHKGKEHGKLEQLAS